MNPSNKQERRARDIALLEEAVHLVRRAPARILACHWTGSLPFVGGLLYFWEDMSRSAFAAGHLAFGAAVLALLFAWMQTWQTVFAVRLLALRRGDPELRLSFRRLVRLALAQGVVQPWSLLLLPLAMAVGLPFGHTYAFFQNVQILDADDHPGLARLLGRSARQACLWPWQNHLAIWLLSPWPLLSWAALGLVILPLLSLAGLSGDTESLLYLLLFLLLVVLSPLGTAVAANAGLALLLIPELLRSFLGLETAVSLGGSHLATPLFFAVTTGIAYLCLDPLMKSVYVLRCFYGEAVATGADLRSDLRRFRHPAIVVVAAVLAVAAGAAAPAALAVSTGAEAIASGTPAGAGPNPGLSGQLDEAIDREITRPEYSWRLPRVEGHGTGEHGLLTDILNGLAGWLDGLARDLIHLLNQFGDWLRWLWRRLGPAPPAGQLPAGLPAVERALLWLLLSAMLVMVGLLGFKLWRTFGRKAAGGPVAGVATPPPDLRDEQVTPAELPGDGWEALSRDLLAQGECRLALRAIYFAILAGLAEHRLLTLSRFKTDGEYRRELHRRAWQEPDLLARFADSAALYARGWYSRHPVDGPTVGRMDGLRQAIQASLGRPQA